MREEGKDATTSRRPVDRIDCEKSDERARELNPIMSVRDRLNEREKDCLLYVSAPRALLKWVAAGAAGGGDGGDASSDDDFEDFDDD